MNCLVDDFIAGLCPVGQAQIVRLDVEIEEGCNQGLPDPLPHDIGHFVAGDFHDGLGYLELIGLHF